MFGFWVGAILGGLLLVASLIYAVVRDRETAPPAWPMFGLTAVVFALSWGLTSFFTQSPGEAMVLKSITGDVLAQPSVTSGLHGKAPWVKVDPWDIRDNTLSFAGAKEDVDVDFNGGDVTGPRITVQDANDVDANFDLTLRYSVQGDKVVELSNRFGSQEDLLIKVIEPEIRSAIREAASPFTTNDIVSKRSEIQAAVREHLTSEWADLGIVVEAVDVQETIQPQAIKDANAAKAAALIAVETEQANRDKAIIEAEKNAIATAQLTPEILMARKIQALQTAAEKGSLVVIPEDFNGIINLPAPVAAQ